MDELGASRPGSLSVVAHPPGFGEDVTASDLMLVWEAFFHKAGGVADLLLSRLASTLPRMNIRSHSSGVERLSSLSLDVEILVLADQLMRSLSRVTNLEERVL